MTQEDVIEVLVELSNNYELLDSKEHKLSMKKLRR